MNLRLTNGYGCFVSKTGFLVMFLLSVCLSGCVPEQAAEQVAEQKETNGPNQIKEETTEPPTQKSQLQKSQLKSSKENSAPTESNLNDQTSVASEDMNAEDAEDLVASLGFAEADNSTTKDPEGNQAVSGKPSEKEPYQPICNVFDSGRDHLPHKQERVKFCKKISNRLASVSMDSCMSAQLELSGCNSVGGVPLMLREFAPIEGKQPLGRVLIIGGTHGDELTSVSITFRWIETLNKYHSGLFHWHVIPSMNPDGLLKRGATRTNKNGIDLNRNLPSEDWTKNALKYWKTKGDSNPRRYPGLAPNSEPETQWLVDEINQFKPDAIISIHAPYGVVDFDAHRLNTAPKSLGKLRLNLLGTYPGSLGNYAGINLNIPVITLELPHAWEMPSQKESQLIWEDIVQWLKINLPERAKALAAKD